MGGDDMCGICQEETMTEPTEIQECRHCFCFVCISKWCNVSNSCPLCQCRFHTLVRRPSSSSLSSSATASTNKFQVSEVDRREENWMEMMEDLDSGGGSDEDDEEEEGNSQDEDRYEEDFVLPDDVVVYDNGRVVRRRHTVELPSGRPTVHQKDCIIRTRDGDVITIKWNLAPVLHMDTSDDEFQLQDEDDDAALDASGEDIALEEDTSGEESCITMETSSDSTAPLEDDNDEDDD